MVCGGILQKGDVVMKMEFDDEADAAADGSEMGLTARLTKKIKKGPVKGKITCTPAGQYAAGDLLKR